MPKAAVIQDISGLGRCSLGAALPVLAALGVHACPVPAAVLTCQTGFPHYTQFDCAPLLRECATIWKELGVRLDGVCTGFLGSPGQLAAAQAFLEAFPTPLLLVDPVLGDDGIVYPCFDENFCGAMRSLVQKASVLTPNVTELCLLTGGDYQALLGRSEPEQLEALERMCETLPSKLTVVTGWRCGGQIGNVIYNGSGLRVYQSPALGGSYSGTGDLFAASLFGYLLRGDPPETALPKVIAFLELCLRDAHAQGLPPEEGVPFELHLKEMKE
ncbi:MAG: bifunctional hydroxymethylpyrimidine kinase/phosphomethylpyrimidine kinase [Oscillospiraceae bacterium]|nr:bifunctional hydroxymethylpyrimidine kinase/phosphomethylpyrimidine kinase [Oscillospiraceae bacterium]